MNLESITEPKRIGNNGGVRPGAGRPPGTGKGSTSDVPPRPAYVKPQEAVDFDKAKAKSETFKAARLELEFKIATGEYISRASVQQAAASSYQALAQTMRSIGDNLERQGVPLEVCALVEEILSAAMEDHAKDMEFLAS